MLCVSVRAVCDVCAIVCFCVDRMLYRLCVMCVLRVSVSAVRDVCAVDCVSVDRGERESESCLREEYFCSLWVRYILRGAYTITFVAFGPQQASLTASDFVPSDFLSAFFFSLSF